MRCRFDASLRLFLLNSCSAEMKCDPVEYAWWYWQSGMNYGFVVNIGTELFRAYWLKCLRTFTSIVFLFFASVKGFL